MTKNRRIVNAVTNSGFGKISVADIDVGMRIYDITMAVTVTSKADQLPLASELFSSVVLKIGGDAKRTFTFAQLETMQTGWDAGWATQSCKVVSGVDTYAALDANHVPYQAKFFLTMHFAEDFRTDYLAKVFGALYTQWEDDYQLPSVTLELGLGACGTTIDSAVAPVIDSKVSVTSELGPVVNKVRQDAFVFFDSTSATYAGVGYLPMTKQFELKDTISEIVLFPAGSDVISKVIVERNGTRVLDDISVVELHNQLIQMGWNKTEIIAKTAVRIAFDADDIPSSGLPLYNAQSFLVKPYLSTVASGGQLAIVIGRYGRLTV